MSTFSTATNFPVGRWPNSVVVGDFNKDGKPDIATSNGPDGNVSILLGTGTGSFGTATNFSAGIGPASLALGDFNSDGNLDIAAPWASGGEFPSYRVAILLGNGTGSFGTPTSFDTGAYRPSSVAVGDFNSDGKPDLAAANTAGNVSILLGTGTGSFGVPTNFNVGTIPQSVVAGDFNADGKLDLATANYDSNNVSILLGTGTGSFAVASNFNVGTNPRSVVAGDFNGDGKLDLATANNQSNNVSILLGTGTGSFGAATNFNAGTSPYSVTVGDFNRDNKSDLALANSGANSNTVSILLGDGTGSFGAAANFGAGANPYSVTVGDFNADGKTDLATANNDSNNVSVLLNNTPVVNFGAAAYSATEGNADTIVNIPVTISSSPVKDLTVAIALNPSSSATQTSDYTFSPTTLTFAADTKTLTQNVAVTVKADNIPENAETAVFNLGTITDGIAGTTKQTTLTIAANDAVAYAIATGSATIAEGNSGKTSVTFTVTRSGGINAASSVNYAIGGTATNVSDYNNIGGTSGATGTTGTINFGASQTSRTITLDVLGDSAIEPDETITVTLSNPVAPGPAPAITTATASTTITNDDSAGFTINPVSGLSTTETGGTATFTVKLKSQPTANVTLGLSSSNTAEGTVSSNSLTFTPANWNALQTVKVTGVDDSIADGNKTYNIVTAAAVSTDTNYNNLNPADVSVTNTDNETPGITVNPIAGLTTTEAGDTANFSIVLNTQPTAPVAIALTSSNLAEGKVSQPSLTFTPTNWNQPQTVTVTGVDDTVADGDIAYKIVTTAKSTDSNYNNINLADVSVTNSDKDTAGVSINPASTTATEGGATGSYTLKLNSQPTAPVTISFDGGNQISAIASVTFDSTNWNIAKTVTVTATDDAVVEGNHSEAIDHTATSTDVKYNAIVISPVNVAITDNDTAPTPTPPTPTPPTPTPPTPTPPTPTPPTPTPPTPTPPTPTPPTPTPPTPTPPTPTPPTPTPPTPTPPTPTPPTPTPPTPTPPTPTPPTPTPTPTLPTPTPSEEPTRATAKWTFMVYMAADNDLEPYGIKDFLEMSSVGSNSDVNIVVQFDRTPQYDSSYDNWTDTRQGLIKAGDLPNSKWGTSIGEANMGDPNNLKNFLNWGIANYPADKYAIVVWDHGDGWRGATTTRGVAHDYQSGDYLENREVGAALAGVPKNMDLIGFDACLMAMLEVAHQVKDEASVFVGSQQLEPGDGWPYDPILSQLKANPTWGPAQLGSAIVTNYGASYGGGQTQSAIDLSKVNNLSAAMSQLATAILTGATTGDIGKLQVHRNNSPYFYYSNYRDLGKFLANVAGDSTISGNIRTTAQTALNAYSGAIIKNHSSPSNGGTGLSIYLQSRGEALNPDYNSTIIDFADDTQWDEFLKKWQSLGVNRPPVLNVPFREQGLSLQPGANFGRLQFTFQNNTFTDPDPGDTLTYTADWYQGVTDFGWRYVNGKPSPFPKVWSNISSLPIGMTFDASNRTFKVDDSLPRDRIYWIRVTAKDAAGASDIAFFDFYNQGLGSVIDGYIAGATVFLDANKNGLLDASEPSATTGPKGEYDLDISLETFDKNKNGELDPEEGNIVAFGGTDTATGLPLETPVTAPPYATVVTLLTSLVADLIDKGVAPETAQSLVNSSLSIPAEIDITDLDPIAATENNLPGGVATLAAMVKVQNFITQTAALIDGASSATTNAIVKAVVSAITTPIQSGTVLNLSNAATLEPIIQQAGAKIKQIDPSFNSQKITSITSQAATVMATANQRIDTAVSSTTTSIPEAVARVQKVTLGATTQDFKAVGAGNKTISQVVTDNTGAALDSKIQAVILPVGIAVPVVTGDADLGSNSPDRTIGTNGDDILTGDSANNVLMGMRGNDSLDGGPGNDSLFGGKDRDILLGGTDDDTLFGGRGADSLNGGDGNDILLGGKGDDALFGGLGSDTLTGGNGNDNFLLSTNSGIDTITDFEDGKDLLVLGGGLTFSQLSIIQENSATFIRFSATGEILASLNGVSASMINAADFSLA